MSDVIDFIDDFWARGARRHAQEVVDGLHDGECEWADNHRICHCSKRRREASGHTDLPTQDLDFTPDCPRCYKMLWFDGDSWVCAPCSLSWDADGSAESAVFTDDYGDLSWCEEHQRRGCPPSLHLTEGTT